MFTLAGTPLHGHELLTVDIGDTERSATKNWFLKETYKEVWKADEEF